MNPAGGRVAPLAGAWIETKAFNQPAKRWHASLPSRERGLKPLLARRLAAVLLVAPLAGAWIETSLTSRLINSTGVAPLAGAWIETRRASLESASTVRVAPLAGAWIETVPPESMAVRQMSLPSRERGLKLDDCTYYLADLCRSLPSRERGLKPACLPWRLPACWGRSPRGSVD